MVTVVLGSGTLEAAELVSKAKGFAVDFPVPAKETALPAPENAVAMTEWAGELLRRSFSVFVIDWGPPDPWADTQLDLLRDDMSQEFGEWPPAGLPAHRRSCDQPLVLHDNRSPPAAAGPRADRRLLRLLPHR